MSAILIRKSNANGNRRRADERTRHVHVQPRSSGMIAEIARLGRYSLRGVAPRRDHRAGRPPSLRRDLSIRTEVRVDPPVALDDRSEDGFATSRIDLVHTGATLERRDRVLRPPRVGERARAVAGSGRMPSHRRADAVLGSRGDQLSRTAEAASLPSTGGVGTIGSRVSGGWRSIKPGLHSCEERSTAPHVSHQ